MLARRDLLFDLDNLAFCWDFFPGDNLAIDVYEKDDRLVVKTALPGLRPEDIHVHVQNGFLTIQAQDEAAEEQNARGWYLRRQRAWAWQRSLRLPMDVDVDSSRADLKDGILTITLFKSGARKKLANRIKINLPKLKLPTPKKGGKKIRISR